MSVTRCFVLASLVLTWIMITTALSADQTESFWERLLRITGISATSRHQKGPGDVHDTGDIWVANVTHHTRQRLTWDGGYRSPVFEPGDEHILALKGESLIRLSASGGDPESRYILRGALKLVGFNKDNQDQVLLLRDDAEGQLAVGLLSLQSGKVVPLPYDPRSTKDRDMLSQLKGWSRTYGDNTTVYIKQVTQQTMAGRVQSTDIYIKQPNQAPVNLSKCQEVSCGQPSLSHDGERVVFIKLKP